MERVTETKSMSAIAPFRTDISAARAAVWADLELSEASVEHLEHGGTCDDKTLLRVVELEGELRRHIASDGPAEGLASFVAAAVDFADASDRHCVINLVELIGGRHRSNGQRNKLPPLAWQGWIDPADPYRCRRVLTDIELAAVRYTSTRTSVRNLILFGLAEAGATIDEAAEVNSLSFDLQRFEVALPGGNRIDPRIGVIPGWARETVRRVVELHLTMSDSVIEKPILYSGRKTTHREIQKSVSMGACKVFTAAGLRGPRSAVSFESIRNTIGRRMADAGSSTDDVARFLGLRNLDGTRTRIGFNPAREPRRRTRAN